MRTSTTLCALIGLAAISASFAPAASAHDWSMGIGIGIPGYIAVPAPGYARPPPSYYEPDYDPSRYCLPPVYYRPPVRGYDGYEDRDWHHHEQHPHHHHDDDDDDDDDE